MSDALSIGWFYIADHEVGPFSLKQMQAFWAEGKLDKDAHVRHSLQEDYAFVGDVEELRGPAPPEESIFCFQHPRRAAVRFCATCRGPICKSCAFAHWQCKRCHNHSYDRRLLAGVFDYLLLPVAVGWLLQLLYEVGGKFGPITSFSLTVSFLGLFLFRDQNGASPGKRLFGLELVDVGTGRPCSSLASLQRNLLPTLLWAFPLFSIWWAPLLEVPHTILFLLVYPLLYIIICSRVYSDPQLRRAGDGLAGTRVVVNAEGRVLRRAIAAYRLEVLKVVIRYPRSARPERKLPGRTKTPLSFDSSVSPPPA